MAESSHPVCADFFNPSSFLLFLPRWCRNPIALGGNADGGALTAAPTCAGQTDCGQTPPVSKQSIQRVAAVL